MKGQEVKHNTFWKSNRVLFFLQALKCYAKILDE